MGLAVRGGGRTVNDLRALVVTPDGEIEEKWLPAAGQDFLESLYAVINCDTVEAVRLGECGRQATMYVDEEGRLPIPNEYATVLVGGFNHAVDQMYYGTAVFLGSCDRHGDDTSLSDRADTYIRALMVLIKFGAVTIRSLQRGQF